MNKNMWVCYGDQVAQWDADLSPLKDQPQTMLDWVCQVVALAEQYSVFRVIESPSIGFVQGDGSTVVDRLQQLYQESKTVDLFSFIEPTSFVMSYSLFRNSGKVAYFDETGDVIEDYVEQLGVLLARYRPDHRGRVVVSPRPPLLIGGPRLCFSDLKKKKSRSKYNYKAKSVHVYFSTSSEIWQPWVSGIFEDDFSIDKKIGNTTLALRHTPRLNAFFRDVREVTLRLGGAWSYASDLSTLDWTKLYCDSGVLLGG